MLNRICTVVGLGCASVASWAVGVPNADVTKLMDDAKATFDSGLTIGLVVMGTLIAVAVGRAVWKKVAR